MTVVVALLILALALVIAEVMFPSFGLLGLSAATAFVFAVIRAFEVSTNAGYYSLAATLLLAPTGFFLGVALLKYSPVGSSFILSSPDAEASHGAASRKGLSELVGRSAVAVSDLRPAGTIEVDGRLLDGVSDGVFIESGSKITIQSEDGNRLIVILETSSMKEKETPES